MRVAAFAFLGRLRQTFGSELPRKIVKQGFDLQGQQVTLLGARGIWGPAILPEMPLSITTVPPHTARRHRTPTSSAPTACCSTAYQGSDPFHRDNVGLRLARQHPAPLVHFVGRVEGWYEAIWPLYVIDDPVRLTFTLVAEALTRPLVPSGEEPVAEEAERRRYITREVQQRLHQQLFRAQVIRAHAETCAICRLRGRELLGAAHILADTNRAASRWCPTA